MEAGLGAYWDQLLLRNEMIHDLDKLGFWLQQKKISVF